MFYTYDYLFSEIYYKRIRFKHYVRKYNQLSLIYLNDSKQLYHQHTVK